MAANFQSIFESNGSTHELDNSTGTQPACNASKNLKIKESDERLYNFINSVTNHHHH